MSVHRLAPGATGAMNRRSVDALWRKFADRRPPIGLGLAPQLEGAPQQLTTFLLAILLDQLLQARKLCLGIGVWRNHAISVSETSTKYCPLLHSRHRRQQAYSRGLGPNGHEWS
jgi:hypothetical protein